jgi:hypothetical protein
MRNETYLQKYASLAPIGSQILQIETKEMFVNASQKITWLQNF